MRSALRLSCSRSSREWYGWVSSLWPATYWRHTPGNTRNAAWISNSMSHSGYASNTTRWLSKLMGVPSFSSVLSLPNKVSNTLWLSVARIPYHGSCICVKVPILIRKRRKERIPHAFADKSELVALAPAPCLLLSARLYDYLISTRRKHSLSTIPKRRALPWNLGTQYYTASAAFTVIDLFCCLVLQSYVYFKSVERW